MSEEKKRKNKIIGISIGILVVLLVVISSTYAYWQITKSQDDPNKIIAACLDFNVDFPVGITEENKWPMSSSEAMNTIDGYTFTVTNNCPEDVTYVVGLESVTSDNIASYLSDTSVGIGFDGVNKGTYSSLTDLEGPTMDARGSKKLQTAIVKGKSDIEGENVNTHNLKLWIDESSDIEEQSKGFSGKLFITGGQKVPHDLPNPLTPEECFEMSGEEIIGYDESCGDSVVIPATVNGVKVTTIDTNAFKSGNTSSTYYDMSNNVISSIDKSSAIVAVVLENHEKGTMPDLANLLTDFDYGISYSDDADTNATIQGMVGERPLYYQNSTTQNFPGFNDGELVIYMSDLAGSILGMEYIEFDNLVKIKELDLSQAYNLEKIEAGAFSNFERGADYFNTPAIAEQLATKPVSLTSLKFAKTDKQLIIGWSAFNGIDVDTLEVYTNLVPEEIDTNLSEDESYKEYYLQNWTDNHFAGARVNNLIVSSVGEDTVVNYGTFEYLIANQITISEGVTEIEGFAFHGHNVQGLNSKNISLPNSLVKVGKNAFTDIENIVFDSGTCDGIEIESPGWDSDSVVTPSTCQP